MRTSVLGGTMLAAAALAACAAAPATASAAYCGAAYGDDYEYRNVDAKWLTYDRYAVYTLGATRCAFALRWAKRLSFSRQRGGTLAPAWPDNPRTKGNALVPPLPPGHRCRRTPVNPHEAGFTVGPAYCRRVPEPKGRARFWFYPDARPRSETGPPGSD